MVGDTSITQDPKQWNYQELKDWKRKSYPTGVVVQKKNLVGTNVKVTENQGSTNQGENTGPVILSTKIADYALISWRRGRRDPKQYEVLVNDVQYTDWIIKIDRQFKNNKCLRMIQQSFQAGRVKSGLDSILNELQKNLLLIILERILKSPYGLKISRVYKNDPLGL